MSGMYWVWIGTTKVQIKDVFVYTKLRDEIIKGYESGTREIYVADENGPYVLTRDEELRNLDTSYKTTLDEFTTREKANAHAREIIGREINKIASLH